ncbi:MAG: hypothetical protein JXQ90_16525 [Cyclobacteriaceae bacterium]
MRSVTIVLSVLLIFYNFQSLAQPSEKRNKILEHLNTEQFEEARLLSIHALIDDDKNADLYYNLGISSMSLSRLEEASFAMEEAVSLTGKSLATVDLQLSLAKLYLLQGEHASAIQLYNNILLLDRANAKAYFGRALASERLGDVISHCKDLRKSASLGNEQALVHVVGHCDRNNSVVFE